MPSLSESGSLVFFKGESRDISMSSSSSSSRVMGLLLNRESFVADACAISEMSLIIGSSDVNWPRQPLRLSRFFRVTKHPQLTLSSGSSEDGGAILVPSMAAVALSRTMLSKMFFCFSVILTYKKLLTKILCFLFYVAWKPNCLSIV